MTTHEHSAATTCPGPAPRGYRSPAKMPSNKLDARRANLERDGAISQISTIVAELTVNKGQ
jgi:hypothetical protein